MLQVIGILISLFLVVGCQEESGKSNSDRLDSLETQVRRLNLHREIQAKSIQRLFSKIRDVAYFEPTDESFQPVRTDVGIIFLSIRNIRPYANGSKVTFRFGNPLNADISGLKATIEWGKMDEEESERSKEHIVLTSIDAGKWNPVDITLDGIPPSELGYIVVKEIICPTVSLVP